MKPLSDLFEKYKKNIKPPQAAVEEVCREIILEVCGFELDSDAVRYSPSTRTISLTGPSVVKQEITLQAGQILKLARRKLGESACPKHIR